MPARKTAGMSDVRQRTVRTNGIDLQVMEAGRPGDPVVVLAHGFPECAHSWRHQFEPLAAAGYHVLAPDQRGYGHSARPATVDAYSITDLTADLVGLLDDVGAEQAVFVGHDWGSLITWEVARLHPQRTRAVVGVSVPFTPWIGKPTDLFRSIYADRFFYMLYFQPVGPAEAEFEADVRRTMHSFMWAASGARFRGAPDVSALPPMKGTGMLDLFTDIPDELPTWLTAADLDHYVAQFEHSGFFGPVSYYRNLDANYEVLKEVPPTRIAMPSFFIGGTCDVVVAGRDDFVDAVNGMLPGYRGKVMIDGAGHWTQQEAPEEFNVALLGFLAGL